MKGTCAGYRNADLALRFRHSIIKFVAVFKPGAIPLRISLDHPRNWHDIASHQTYPPRQREISIAKAAYAATFILAMVSWTSQALASQGPGTKPGTASEFIQLGMAILVYGTSALVIGVGLIGAARRH